MSCGMGMIKYILFIFNFIFALCGLALLIVGIVKYLDVSAVSEITDAKVSFPSVTLIVLGALIFAIAFFGCCGAIQESHCMTIIYASCLLTILIIQVAVTIYAFAVLKSADDSDLNIKENYKKIFLRYWDVEDSASRNMVDAIQDKFHCCGVESPKDFRPNSSTHFNGTIPWSCCAAPKGEPCNDTTTIYQQGCAGQIKEILNYAGNVLGGVALGIAGVELVGIIFALCLANSIKNSERRGYRV